MTVLEIGTTSAVINFNAGTVGMFRVLAKLGIILGSNTIDSCNKRDKARIYQTNKKEIDLVKHQRRLTQNNMHRNDTKYFEFLTVGRPGEVNRQPYFMLLPIYQLVASF